MKKVFISSVGKGLEEHRAEVYRAANRLEGYHCVRMEDFGARDAASADLCREKVRQCDIFVGIVGPRYGSCPVDSYVSFTELEYDTAVNKGMPRLLFVTSDEFQAPIGIREDDKTFKTLEVFRRKVLTNRVVDYFSGAQELATKVVSALHNSQPGPPSCQVYCVPALVRSEGWTERLGDIRITVYGAQRPEQVDVSLTLDSNATNHLDPSGIPDVTLTSERHSSFTRGRLVAGRVQ